MIRPSLDKWLEEAKSDPTAHMCGSYISHTGTVRSTPKSTVRNNESSTKEVVKMRFSCDRDKISAVENAVLNLPGVYYVKIWVNEGLLNVGDDIMQILIGGDIRPRAVEALNFLLSQIKDNCVTEEEFYNI